MMIVVAAILMSVVGTAKYGERTYALWWSNFSTIGNYLKLVQHDKHQHFYIKYEHPRHLGDNHGSNDDVGYIIRIMAPIAIVASLLLFHFNGKGGHNRIDVIITYVLLGGALVLETRSLLRSLWSTWGLVFLCDTRWSWLRHVALCSGRWHRLRQQQWREEG
uniref:DUF4220 domain-containing protein n=1 Tax=Oryza rufipogon TaxID=4529 RepID=A0A0E0P551_ORYRU